jgi:splicing factor 3B subunit 3
MRIFVADAQESVFFLKFKKRENNFSVYAVDSEPRFVTSLCCLDYDTVAIGDKFGNIVMLRLPTDLSTNVEQNMRIDGGLELSCQSPDHYRLKTEASFYLGDIITALQKTVLQSGGDEILIYSTVGGSIGAFLPIGLRDDADFFQHLEMYLRQDAISLLGSDHLGYRSYYQPCRNVIDGDYCELYSRLRRPLQENIAESLDCTPRDITKKIEAICNKVI